MAKIRKKNEQLGSMRSISEGMCAQRCFCPVGSETMPCVAPTVLESWAPKPHQWVQSWDVPSLWSWAEPQAGDLPSKPFLWEPPQAEGGSPGTGALRLPGCRKHPVPSIRSEQGGIWVCGNSGLFQPASSAPLGGNAATARAPWLLLRGEPARLVSSSGK